MRFTVLTTLSLAALSVAAPTTLRQSTHATARAPSQKRDDYQSAVLDGHNSVRSQHGAGALTWDDDLANSASTAAGSCDMAHQMGINGGDYGQNLEMGGDIGTAIASWAAEGNDYPFFGQNPDWNAVSGFGHFTQMVWKATTSVGCFTQDCGSGPFTVCNYRTPGNVDGQFADNV